jgi:hypothetical protein
MTFARFNLQGVFFDQCGIKPLLHSVLDGFAATCFAYGQTGSGKTYSLIGPESTTDKLDQRSSEQDGLLSRAVKFLFSEIKRRETAEHVVEVSYCEIYNEQVRDLLGKASGAACAAALPVRYNPHQGFFVEGLTTVRCQNKAEVMRCFCQGFKTTRVGAHDMNQRSNRSHCIFNIHVHIKTLDEEQGASQVAHGKMCFVDLAGSERVRDTQAVGKTLAESGQINKSLFVLGKVISALTTRAKKGERETRVPYRDSTLTRLLMSSLGGTCKTLMVTCCSSSSEHVSESLRSLHFASRAKHIRNKVCGRVRARVRGCVCVPSVSRSLTGSALLTFFGCLSSVVLGACVCVCTYIYARLYVSIRAFVCIYTCMYIYGVCVLYPRVCISTCLYIYIYIVYCIC